MRLSWAIVFLFLYGAFGNVIKERQIRTTLMKDKLLQYSRNVHPTNEFNEPVRLSVGFGLISMVNINEREEALTTNGWINAFWKDERLAWNLSEYNVTGVYYHQKDIWTPDLYVANSLQERHSSLGFSDMLCYVTPDGTVSWMPGDIFKTKCELDVTYFPFDAQMCTIVISSWMMRDDALCLTPIPVGCHINETYDTLYIAEDASNSLWDTLNISLCSVKQEHYMAGAVVVTFHLKRCPSFYVLNLILPMICISALICLVFAVPADQGDRVSFSMSILLSFVVFLTLLGDHLPETSRQTSILTVYLTVLLLICALSVCLAVLTLRVSTYQENREMPMFIKNVFTPQERNRYFVKVNKCFKGDSDEETDHTEDNSPIKLPIMTWKDLSFYMDRVFMVTFLVLIVLANVIYLTFMVSVPRMNHNCNMVRS